MPHYANLPPSWASRRPPRCVARIACRAASALVLRHMRSNRLHLQHAGMFEILKADDFLKELTPCAEENAPN
jgi:hypothetical protein